MTTIVLGSKGFIGGAVHKRVGGIGLTRQDQDLEAGCTLPYADTVYMCAGETGGVGRMTDDPLSFVLPNVRMHMNVFEACAKAGVRRVVCVGSTTGYPDSASPMVEDDYLQVELHPAYVIPGNAHRFIYRLAQMFTKSKGLEISFVRPSNVYGPGNDFSPNHSHVIEATVRKVAERQDPIVIWGDGKQVRDGIYIDDLVEAMVLAAQGPVGAYNVGSGDEMSVLEIVYALCRHAAFTPRLEYDPSKPLAIPVRRVDTTKARTVLGWKPKVMMRDGLAATYDWFLNERR